MSLNVKSCGGKFRFALVYLLGLASAASTAATAQEAQQPLYAGRNQPFAGKSLEQKIQELADREEIRELTAIYAHRVAHGLSIADLFTDDGAYIHIRPGRPDNVVRGRAALEEHFKDRPAEAEHPLPMIHNFIIAIDGDEGRGINSNELRISDDGKSIIASGYYEDRYRRENGRWRFAMRKITFVHWVPIQQGWARQTEPE